MGNIFFLRDFELLKRKGVLWIINFADHLEDFPSIKRLYTIFIVWRQVNLTRFPTGVLLDLVNCRVGIDETRSRRHAGNEASSRALNGPGYKQGRRDGRLGWGNSATLRTQTLLKF